MAKTQGRKERKESVILFKQFTVKQFVSLIIGSLFALTGLALIITELVGTNLASVTSALDAYESYKAALASFNYGTHTSIGFLGWGIISLLFGTVIVAFALSLSAKTEDRAKESEARKAARRKDLLKNVQQAPIEAEVEETK